MSEYRNHDGIIYTRATREMPWNRPFRMKVYYYFIDGLMIDTGPRSLADIAIPFFQANKIEQVAFTHIHEDHCGMAAWLQDKNIPLFVHPGAIREAASDAVLSAYRVDIWGERKGFSARPLPEYINTEKHRFRVIDSPGHCRYHNIFWEESRGWLFSGDLIVDPEPAMVFCEEDISVFIETLKKVLKLDFSTVFCAHTGIHQDGKRLFEKKLDYLLQLRNKVKEMRKSGLDDLNISEILLPGDAHMCNMTDGEFAAIHVIKTI